MLKNITTRKADGALRVGAAALHPDWQSLGGEKVKDWG
jgi:hypothetical protein